MIHEIESARENISDSKIQKRADGEVTPISNIEELTVQNKAAFRAKEEKAGKSIQKIWARKHKQLDLNTVKAAKMLGVSQSTVSRHVNGKLGVGTELSYRYADLLDVGIHEIREDLEDRKLQSNYSRQTDIDKNLVETCLEAVADAEEKNGVRLSETKRYCTVMELYIRQCLNTDESIEKGLEIIAWSGKY